MIYDDGYMIYDLGAMMAGILKEKLSTERQAE